MIIKSEYDKIQTYVTKDGSLIRELIHPSRHGPNVAMSLAEAVVPLDGETTLHRHLTFQEIYHFLEGEGIMTLGEESFSVKVGDSVLIPAGTPHKVANTGTASLRFLCCCTPPYTHEETELLESS